MAVRAGNEDEARAATAAVGKGRDGGGGRGASRKADNATTSDCSADMPDCMAVTSECMAAKLLEKWRRDAVSCSLVMVGRVVDTPVEEVARGSDGGGAEEGGGETEADGAGGGELMVAGGSEVSGTKLVDLRILPEMLRRLYG